MDTFAEYILNEKKLASKMEIVYYLSKKMKIFYDKSVIFKTELVRLFLDYSKIEVDRNLVLTASLLCNCKKVDNAQDIEKIHSYAKEGANFLREMGFEKRFCKICEEINRYSGSNPRERESDILELADQFGGMLLDRPERAGFKPDEALVLLEHRNLKDVYNRYLITFIEFVNLMARIDMRDTVDMSSLKRLVKIHNDSQSITKFIENVINNYEPEIDKKIYQNEKNMARNLFSGEDDPNRPLFSQETAKKVLEKLDKENGGIISV